MCKNKPHYRDMRKYLDFDPIKEAASIPSIGYFDKIFLELIYKGLEPTGERIFGYKINDEPNESDMEFQQFIIDNYNKLHNVTTFNEKDFINDNYNKLHNINEKDNNNE